MLLPSNRLARYGFFLVLLIFLGFFPSFSDAESNPESLTPPEFSASSEDIIYFVPQFSDFQEVSIHEMKFLKHILKEAKENNVKAVIFELDTPGGRIDVALKYVSILSKSEVPTIAFVNPQGISAGMIIALAADRIAINPMGTIGDAMPMELSPGGKARAITEKPEEIEKKFDSDPKEEENKNKQEKKKDNSTLQKILKELNHLGPSKQIETPEEKKLRTQKFLTVYFKILQVLAQKNNRPVKVIRAMADPYQKLTVKEDGIEHQKVSPLTLSAVEAQNLKVVDYICRNKTELKQQLGLENCKIEMRNKTPIHFFILLLANPILSSILIAVGLIGIYTEVRTPGFGVPGAFGLIALALFFLGHIGVGDSNWIPPLVFIVGVILLAIEVFVIPGFGVVGIFGIIGILGSLVLAFGVDNLQSAVNIVGISLLATVLISVLLTIYVLPKSKFFRKLTLSASNTNEEGFSSHEKESDDLVGKEGIVYNTLRPTGIAIIDGKRLDVVAEGDFIEKGENVKIVNVTGMRIVVAKKNDNKTV